MVSSLASQRDLAPNLAVVLQGFDQGGGVATSCLNQIRILSARYRITLFTEAGWPQLRPLPEGVVVRRLPVPALRWLHRFAHVPRQWLFIQAVRRGLLGPAPSEGFAAVIFHSHPPAALLAPSLRRRRIGSILVVHGDIFDRPPGTYDRRLTFWYRWATPRAYRRVSGIVSLSSAMVPLVRRWTKGQVPIHLVPNSIDPAELGLAGAPLPAPAAGGDAELLYVGRIEPLKGIDLLLQATASLLKTGRQLKLRCIGAVSPRYQEELERRLDSLGLRQAVRFVGPLPSDQLGASYRRCLLLVVPSRSEPQATVVLEGMAAGCPIVASDVGGNSMMLEHGSSGLLFPRDDLPALVRCLEQLLDDAALRQRLGEEARRRFQTSFSRQVVAPRLFEAVAPVVQASRPSGSGLTTVVSDDRN